MTRIKEDIQPRSRHYEPDIKISMFNLFESWNASDEVIAESFGITPQTIYNWRKAYEKDGMVEPDVTCRLVNFRIMLRKNTLAHWPKEPKGMSPVRILQ